MVFLPDAVADSLPSAMPDAVADSLPSAMPDAVADTLAGGTPGVGASPRQPLTPRDLVVFEIEQRRWKYPALKEQAIRERLDMNATRYYQVLNSLLDHPEALAKYPMLVNRLRRAVPPE